MGEVAKRRIFALLVGIDQYPDGVPKLQGCKNDVDAIEQLLKEKYRDFNPHIRKLTNQESTRANIIQGFRSHLSQATAGDTVLFYYSGHGSRENSPQEFWPDFPARKNETLVCYDSRLDGGYDLADKEIAVLISEIAANHPHIVVCLDSCHSGSGTRDSIELTAVRQVEKEGNSRSLETYIDGYYSNQLKKGENVSVPVATHLLLSACQDDEKAYETEAQHGLFTTSLLECLSRQPKGGITYAELFQDLSLTIRTTQKTQHPNFEYLSGFNPHTLFLTGAATDRARTFPVYFDTTDQKWKAGKGAIHGISVEGLAPIRIWIFDDNNTTYSSEEKIAEGAIIDVKPSESTVALTTNLNKNRRYVGFQVDSGVKNAVIYSEIPSENLLSLFDYQEVKDKDVADYWVLAQDGSYQIIHRSSQKVIVRDTSLSNMNLALQKIARWENLKQLKNKKTKLRPADVQLEMTVLTDQTPSVFTGEVVELCLQQSDTGRIETRLYSIAVQNSSGQELHFKLLFVSPLYGIGQLGDAIVPNGQRGNLVVEKRLGFFRDQYNDAESNCVFKLVASTEEIDLAYFEQENFSLNLDFRDFKAEPSRGEKARFLDELDEPEVATLDWFTKAINLRLVKSGSTIGQDKVALADGKVVIQPHSTLRAKVSLTDIFNASRGVESREAVLQSALDRHSVALLALTTATKSVTPPQLIELQDIEGAVSAIDPLIITVQDTTLQTNEVLIPVTVADDSLVVIGRSQTNEQGESEVYIERLPETEAAGTRNVGRALKFCLMKLVFKSNPDTYFQLRWVDFDAEMPVRREEHIEAKVSEANTILLLVHGIIGDTEGMIPFVQEVTKSANTPDNPYDLALTFDYECLNTPIEKIAKNLIKALADAGISDTSGKTVTIIAHSMGGLVSRIMIEQFGKGKLVDKLIMAGTPNGGSNFGKIPSYLSLASDALTLGLSAAFAAPYLAWAAGLVVALKKSTQLTVTLAQMQRNSDFIRELSTLNDPKIPYYILAGRIDQYTISGNSWFDKLSTRLALTVGDLFQKGELHDIAVYTADIEAVDTNRSPKPIKQEVGCPHIFYYDEPESKAIMYGWLKV